MLLLFLKFPLDNPVLIFSVILFIILMAPMFLHRLKIPDLIGLIVAGALFGPNGLGILARDSSIELFGKVGLLYIMFTAGLDIDLADLKKNFNKSLYFGLLTFVIPMILGTVAGICLLGFSWPTSILLASMFASHTLITYPIVSKYGVTKNRAVNISIGATVVTCLLALLVLAIVVGASTGEINRYFWFKLGLSTLVFVGIVAILFPAIGRWFFKRYEDNVAQYIFVLALVFLASFLAKLAGLEDVIGAFLAGLALNRLIPGTSALMNRIDFVGNALFIPFFLIGVGMLVDYRVFLGEWDSLWVALVMCVVATGAKYLAAQVTEKTLHYTRDEGRLLFGLSNSQAAATLAAIMVGYQVILGTDADGLPIRLLDDNVLNGTIVMILVTCTIASFVTQKGAQNVALAELAEEELVDNSGAEDRILIPLSNNETVENLVNLGVTLKSPKAKVTMMALSIIKSDRVDAAAEKRSSLLLEKAVKTAAATDNTIHQLMRYDTNVVSGIKHVVDEHKITDIVLGLRKESDISHTFLGDLAEGILAKCATTTFVCRPVQSLSTVRRYIVVIPEHAELEIGFPYWLVRIWSLARNTGGKMVFYAGRAVLDILKEVKAKHTIHAEFNEFTEWDEFLIVSREIREDDALLVIMSRRNCPSYSRQMALIPGYMNKYFQKNNCILVYPVQMGVGEEDTNAFRSISVLDHYEEEDLATVLRRLFRKHRG
ncbi:MAG: cation:proton antiporter [Culturomica sp.]|nr:cation:proton antiporter [Culturomica sp.]